MTNKEKIREFLVGMANADCCATQVAKTIKKIILPYIDSLQEEPVSEDLEEATKEWSENEDNVRGCDYISLVRVEEAFKAGANWQKDKLIKDAIEGYVDQVEYPGSTWIELSDTPKDLKDGDNVKLTIIKEDKV